MRRAATDISRAFYLAEYLDNEAIRALIDTNMAKLNTLIVPSITPHLQEKAILALLWDKRRYRFFIKQMGSGLSTTCVK